MISKHKIRKLKWRIEYLEKRLKEVDEEKDREDKFYYAETSAIYRVLIEDVIKDFKSE